MFNKFDNSLTENKYPLSDLLFKFYKYLFLKIK